MAMGLAARSSRLAILLRQDNTTLLDQPAQATYIELLGLTAKAGEDRLNGEEACPSVYHSIFDLLHNRGDDPGWASLTVKLGQTAELKSALLADKQRQPNHEEKMLLHEVDRTVIRCSDSLFKDHIKPYFYHNRALPFDLFHPEIGLKFCEAKHWSPGRARSEVQNKGQSSKTDTAGVLDMDAQAKLALYRGIYRREFGLRAYIIREGRSFAISSEAKRRTKSE